MRKFTSISLPLAFRFMLLLAFAMLTLSLLFVSALKFSVTKRQDAELKESISIISESLASSGTDELDFLALPYYITYTVYELESKKVLATNDSLLPLLDSGGKNLTYLKKNFFTDGDLNIRYLTNSVDFKGKTLIVEAAFDISNDSAARMISAFPFIALLSLIPVLFISFVLSFLISRETIASFKKLQADYDREKTFTSNVSHELKTPISIIDGHANLLKRWGKDDPKQLSESIDAILRETGNMNAIVTTLLEMSRLENGKVRVENEKFFVTNFFVKLQEEFTHLCPKIDFEIFDEDFLEIYTDQAKLHQIFTVILSNSIKFASEECKIVLRAKKIGSRIELSAADNGAGFSDEILPYVFERFFKGDSSHNRNVSGAGLGLSIAKTLAEAIGAEITAENAKTGGAVVKILLSGQTRQSF